MSVLIDSDEESRKYSLKEMTKSAETALLGISHFSQKLRSTLLKREKIDLINSVISVHGKESPEVFFFGTILVREWLLALEKSLDAPMHHMLIDNILQSSMQVCVNALNFFKSRANSDSSLVHASFALLHVAASLRLNLQDSRSTKACINPNIVQGLSDLITSDILQALSGDTVGIVLASVCVMAQLMGSHGDVIFVKKQVASHCLDFVENFDQSDPSRFLYSVLYLSLTISTPAEVKDYFVSKFFAKPKLFERLSSLLRDFVNEKLLLFVVIRFISQVLNNALSIISAEESDEDENLGFFGGMLTSSGGSAAEKARIPVVFDSVNIDSFDDIFSLYSQGDSESDINILVALAAIGGCLVKYYGTSNSTRANSVSTTVKKWAFACITSDHAILNACGLTLVTDLRQYTGEPITGILSVAGFRECVDSLYRMSPQRAKEETFEFLRRVAVAAPEAEAECMTFLEVFIERFNFHHLIMRNELLKKLFFKTITMKDAFIRLLKTISTLSPVSPYDQIYVISRVLMQMTLAVKAKGSLIDFQIEFSKLESEKRGVLIGFFRAIKEATQQSDTDTAELLVSVLQELVRNRSENFDKFLMSFFSDTAVCEKISNILKPPKGFKYKPPDLALGEESPTSLPTTVIGTFLFKGSLYYRIEKTREKKKPVEDKNGEDPKLNKNQKQEEGWMDSAANWFIDFAGDIEEEEEIEEEDTVEKNDKKESKEIKTEQSIEGKSLLADPVVVAPAVAKEPPVVKAKAAPKAKSTAVKSVSSKPVPVKAAKPAPPIRPVVPKKAVAVAPPPVEPKKPPTPPPPAEDEEKKKKKKKKEQVDGGLGDYVDPSALYNALGGWLGGPTEEPKKEKKSKKKENSDSDHLSSSPPPAKISVTKVPPVKVPTTKAVPVIKKK